ncbi:MAG: peptidylprolyl isomerase [Chitinophagaceae bacterium]
MKYWYCVLLVVFLFTACASPDYKYPHVVIATQAGDIEIELYPDKAPQTVKAFLSYVDAGYYKGCTFYRVLADDNQPMNAYKANLIQGGIWKTDYKRATSLPGIPHEPTNKTSILHKDGVFSLSRMEPGTATTEFFICIGDQPGFDYGGDNNADGQGYAAFGKVVKGMVVVHKIHDFHYHDEAFDPPVGIINIRRL